MKKPKIGIVTPSFNQSKFIKKTIDSVLGQNYPNLEYWVIDGKSTDQTVKILKSYGKKINWISEKDRGQAHAINKGLKRINADIYAYINSDDVYGKNTFSKISNVFLKEHTDWISGSYSIIDDRDKEIISQNLVVKYKHFLMKHFNRFILKSANSIIPQPSTFWSKKAMKKIGFFDEKLKYTMDYDYWLRLSAYFPLFYIPQVLSKFRLHSDSKSTNFYKQQFKEEAKVLAKNGASSLEKGLHAFHTKLTLFSYSLMR